MKKKLNGEKMRIRSHFMEIVKVMPKLSHWPDRSKPFDYEDSEVCKWLIAQPGIKRWIFDKARNMGVIVFDEGTETWAGKGKDVFLDDPSK